MEYSGAGGKLIHEKNQKQKISWHCPFKVSNRDSKYGPCLTASQRITDITEECRTSAELRRTLLSYYVFLQCSGSGINQVSRIRIQEGRIRPQGKV